MCDVTRSFYLQGSVKRRGVVAFRRYHYNETAYCSYIYANYEFDLYNSSIYVRANRLKYEIK